jgi:hypothetical protein
MRVTTLPLILLMLAGLIQAPASINKVDPGKEFKIKKGEVVVVRGGNFRITFRSVTDSRCPTGVTCVWAGNGEVVIEIAGKNKKQVVARLNTLSEPKEITYKGFKIKLVGLKPYPKINEPIDQKDYEASMIVTRVE